MAMHPFAEDTAPPEYFPAAKPAPVPRATPENPQKRAADEPPGSKRQKTVSAAPFSTSWQSDIERARRATPKGVTFNASVIAHDQPARDAWSTGRRAFVISSWAGAGPGPIAVRHTLPGPTPRKTSSRVFATESLRELTS